MKVQEIKSRISRLEKLHSDFEKTFPGLYGETEREALFTKLKGLHAISQEKLEISTELYKELSQMGGRIGELAKDLYKNEHQMKFRLEELMSALVQELDYEARLKVKGLLDRLIQFHRVYDYGVRKALSTLASEVEGLELIADAENKKKVPAGILDKLRKIDEIEGELEALRRFVYRLYTHPGDVHKVEWALKTWHSQGLLWVEARNVEKLSGVSGAEEILEGLTLIGVVEKRMRGGEGVYRHRSFSSD